MSLFSCQTTLGAVHILVGGQRFFSVRNTRALKTDDWKGRSGSLRSLPRNSGEKEYLQGYKNTWPCARKGHVGRERRRGRAWKKGECGRRVGKETGKRNRRVIFSSGFGLLLTPPAAIA